MGSFISDGTFLYGMTYGGGTGGYGTVFKIKPDGTGDTTIYNFMASPDGSAPYGDLVSDGTFLYGMTDEGGTSDGGTIFRIMPDGTDYSKLLNFGTVESDGLNPQGSLIYDGTYFYGMTSSGGIDNDGIAFKFKPVITGLAINKEAAGFTIHPNPASDIITIECPQEAIIEITSIQGQLIKTIFATGNKTNIDVSALQTGVYVVEVKTEKGIAVQKFVKD
jgi:uncharacterized repeat protein (TIGR03803 family)